MEKLDPSSQTDGLTRMAIPAIVLGLLGLASPGLVAPARCDTVFIDTAPMEPTQVTQSQKQKATEAAGGPVEVFPKSRFGQQPMRVDPGVDQGFVSREVRQMDESEDDTGPASPRSGGARSPASETGGASAPEPGPGMSAVMGSPPRRAISFPPDPDPDAGANLADTIAQRGVQEVSLIAGDLGFFPRTLFVSRDVPVRLFVTGASRSTLCFMMDSFQIRRQIRSSKIEEITFTPGTSGRYRFYCPINGMEGSLIVKELSTASEVRGPNEASAPVSVPAPEMAASTAR